MEYLAEQVAHEIARNPEFHHCVVGSTEDESVHKALNDRSLSLSMVLSFSYKLFNSCLENLFNFTRSTNRPALVGKFRATLNYLLLLSIFTSNDDSTVDWNKLTGGKASDAKLLEALIRKNPKS